MLLDDVMVLITSAVGVQPAAFTFCGSQRRAGPTGAVCGKIVEVAGTMQQLQVCAESLSAS